MARSSHALGCALAGSLLLAGCATESSDASSLEGDELEARRVLVGVVDVEADPTHDGLRSSVAARFVRVAPSDASAATAALRNEHRSPPNGTCERLSSVDRRASHASVEALSLELVDVGDLDVAARPANALPGDPALVATRMSLRAFPDVGDRLSGVFYTTPDATTSLPAPARYSWSTPGAQLVGAFSFDAEAPRPVAGLSIDGRPIEGRPIAERSSEEPAPSEEAPIEIAKGRDLALGWEPAEIEGSSILVELRGRDAWRCSYADEGAARLPSEAIDPDETGSLSVSIHRVVERLVSVAGSSDEPIDPTELVEARVRFDWSRSVVALVR
jgi:hypothetical protein